MGLRLKKTGKRVAALFAAVVMALCLVGIVIPMTAKAAEANEEVLEVANSVFQVSIFYADTDGVLGVPGKEYMYSYGTGFLVNEDTLLTCAHVVDLYETPYRSVRTTTGELVKINDYEYLSALLQIPQSEVLDRISYKITIDGDVYIDAEIVNESQKNDYAIMKLKQNVQTKSPVVIRSSAYVKSTEQVFSIGYPGSEEVVQTDVTYTSDDVTIKDGTVSKLATGQNLYSLEDGTDYIYCSANMQSGISGGPLVDVDGNVIGMCEGYYGETYYAIAIDQITSVLTQLGIEWIAADIDLEPTTTEEETTTEETSPSESTSMQETSATVTEEPTTPTPGSDPLPTSTLIIIIVAAVVVIAIVIILIVVLGKKKKNTPPPTPDVPKQTVAPQVPPRPQTPGFTPAQPTPAVNPMTQPTGAGETTVLSGAGETTLLNRAVNSGTLTNKKSGEKVTINTEEFVIGRERTKVNYCLAGNTSVGRTHAKIVNKNGLVYLVDLNATNGTFVNGVKCAPGQEVLLKSGDRITLADEEFTYQA